LTQSETSLRDPRPIRVQYLTHSLDMGGSERQMVELALGLPQDRFAVSFTLLRSAGDLATPLREAGIPVRVLGFRRTSGGPRARLSALLANARAIIRYVAWTRGTIDLVDAWLLHAYVLAAVARPLTGVRALIAGRRSLSDFKDGFGIVNRRLDELARRRSDLIIANSEFVRDDVVVRERLDRTRIRVIRNAVLETPAAGMPERGDLRRRWGVPLGGTVIGCVANYKPLKGLELIVNLAARLAARHPDVRVVLVGEGPLRPVLERLIAERRLQSRVILHGSEADARWLYPAFDLAVQASETEGLPNVVLEAAAAGLPVVATDAGGTREIVRDGLSGLIVPIGDLDALESAVERLLADPALRAALGSAAARDVRDRFSRERLIGATIEAYEDVMARTPGWRSGSPTEPAHGRRRGARRS